MLASVNFNSITSQHRRRRGLISRTIWTYSTLLTVFLQCFILVIISQVATCDKAPSKNIQDQIAAENRVGPYPPGLDEAWPVQGHHDMPQIKILQVQCEKSYMRVNIEFDRPFYGMIFSKGHYSDPHCVHLAPGSGHLSATYDIYLNACGMTSSANNNGGYGPAPSGTFIENTIIIQYDPLVQEVWDQARKLRCTWYDFYEKSVTFRPFQVDMLHAVTANFLGDNLQCWMQIQVGKGPWASEVSGIVKIGQTMTMVLAIKDDENKFDMLVRNCVAHDGKRAPIQLVDQYGCVTRPKIMSRFHKIKNFGASASVVSYAYFQAFKFPDSMNVHFQCVIQVCRFQCPEPKCGGEELYGPGLPPLGLPDPRIPLGAYSENKEKVAGAPQPSAEDEPEAAQSIQTPQKVPAPPPTQSQQKLQNHVPHPPPPTPGGFAKQQLGGPRPLPPHPSHVMLPPPPRGLAPNYPNVKREGTVADAVEEEDDEEEEEDEQEPSFSALGGRPRSVDFEKLERQQQGHSRRRRTAEKNKSDDHHIVVRFSHVYKREAQEMTDVETTRVIQVVAPGDVAFNLGGASNNASAESVVIETTNRSDIDGICMSVSSFVGGLVMLLLLLVVASLVAAFLFVRVRSIHRKTAIFANGFDNPDYIKHQAGAN
ncbi:Cuticlin-1 [Orchesella cincta]|uniref:Cuticlin-1 n=1 Tax=Orchesella cincta TaxID=48709 RepID=A0A1D2NJH7_ORCCI|nr:Cuticlin-1 [Orchesella cincta]